MERGGVRDSPAVIAFREALRDVTGYGHARVLAQHCGCCHTRFMGAGAAHTSLMVVPSVYGNRAEVFAEWVSRRTPTVIVDGVGVTDETRGEVFYRQAAASASLRCSAAAFVDMCAEQHRSTHLTVSEGGVCHHAQSRGMCRICGGAGGFVADHTNALRFDPSRPELFLSAALRAVPSPVRHIDTDILLVDDHGAPRLVAELSDNPSRSVNYLKSLSELWGVPAVHAITEPCPPNTPLAAITAQATVWRSGRAVMRGGLTDVVQWCEDRV